MPVLVTGIHVLFSGSGARKKRGWPDQVRPWRFCVCV